MINEFSTSPENMTTEPPLVVFYQWLLTEDRELNNILSLFEYRNDTLYLKRKEENIPEETLEMIFRKFQQGRSNGKYMSDQGRVIILDTLRQIFLNYYETFSVTNPGEAIKQEIDRVVPFVKECLRRLIAKELRKQRSSIPEYVSAEVNAITGVKTY